MLKALAVSLFLFSAASLYGQTFVQSVDLPCGDSVHLTGLGYPFWNPPTWVRRPAFGFSALEGTSELRYLAPSAWAGTDTAVVACARATQITCDTGVYIFRTSCAENLPIFWVYEVACGDTLHTDDLSGWGIPTVTEAPRFGSAVIELYPTDGAGLTYVPNTTVSGIDALQMRYFGDTVLVIFHLVCGTTGTPTVPARPWAIYPNPASHLVTFDGLPIFPEKIMAVDLQGRHYALPLVDVPGALPQADVSALADGLYRLNIHVGGLRLFGKLLVMRNK